MKNFLCDEKLNFCELRVTFFEYIFPKYKIYSIIYNVKFCAVSSKARKTKNLFLRSEKSHGRG